MTRPEIIRISQIKENQSIVCMISGENIPGFLSLNDSEKEYALKRIKDGEETIFINSSQRSIYLVIVKEEKNRYRTREETRRHAYKIRKAIRSGDHNELVITSSECYPEAIYDFTEGFVLGIYSFSKYKTKKDDDGRNKYPGKLLLFGNITDEGCLVLKETISAVWFARDLINEPVNHLSAVALAGEIRKAGNAAGFSVEVLNKGKIEALKMGGYSRSQQREC